MQLHFGAALMVLAAALLVGGCNQQKVVEHPSLFSSVQKEDIKVGTGPEATDGDMVFVEYTGKLAKTGATFDTNNPETSDKNKNPLSFVIGPNGLVIPGLMAGTKGMKVGGQRKVSIPWSAAYGATGTEGVPPYADLVFDVKLLYLVKAGDENSVEVVDLKPGTGDVVKQGDRVEVHYKGTFVNNRLFDSTYDRKKTVSFTMGKGEAITGFERGIEGMRVGGKRRLTLAPEAGWGKFGNDVIPGNAALIYEVELVSVKHPGSS